MGYKKNKVGTVDSARVSFYRKSFTSKGFDNRYLPAVIYKFDCFAFWYQMQVIKIRERHNKMFLDFMIKGYVVVNKNDK